VKEVTLIARYPSKNAAKEAVGEKLKYQETSLFGAEYRDDGRLTVANRPLITGLGREWFGIITMKNGRIYKVE
jgi:hypothetical protein